MRNPAVLGTLLSMGAASVCLGQCDSFSYPFGTTMGGNVEALLPWSPVANGPNQLIAGGQFTAHAGFPCDYIGAWTGSNWQALGWGMDGIVRALTTWDPDGAGPLREQLIAGGDFASAGSDATGEVTVNRVALWDGISWHAMAGGMDGRVLALTTWDPDGPGPRAPLLIAAGDFSTAGGTSVDHIAAWNGSVWSSLGWGFNDTVSKLVCWDPDADGPLPPRLVASGAFTRAGSDATGEIIADHLAVWNDTSWSPMGDTSFGPGALSVLDLDGTGPLLPRLVVAAGQDVRGWNGSAWPVLFSPGAGGGQFPSSLGAMIAWDPDGDGPRGDLLAVASDYFSVDCPTPEDCYFVSGTLLHLWDGSVDQVLSPSMMIASMTTWDRDGSAPQRPRLVAAGTANVVPNRLIGEISGDGRPTITRQPTTARTIAGGMASFDIDASGATTYEWYIANRSGSFEPLSDGIRASGMSVAGANERTIAINNVAVSESRTAAPVGGQLSIELYCRASNECAYVWTDVALTQITPCQSDINFDGDAGTDADIEAFFSCLAGSCCPTCTNADFNGDGDSGTDADIEAFFRVLAGGSC